MEEPGVSNRKGARPVTYYGTKLRDGAIDRNVARRNGGERNAGEVIVHLTTTPQETSVLPLGFFAES
jgi:hypothetical protein